MFREDRIHVTKHARVRRASHIIILARARERRDRRNYCDIAARELRRDAPLQIIRANEFRNTALMDVTPHNVPPFIDAVSREEPAEAAKILSHVCTGRCINVRVGVTGETICSTFSFISFDDGRSLFCKRVLHRQVRAESMPGGCAHPPTKRVSNPSY